jgi:hypothetical protein
MLAAVALPFGIHPLCAEGAFCAEGTCAALVSPGGACPVDEACAMDLACRRGACSSAPVGGAGDLCLDGRDCASGLFCDTTAMPSACTPRKPAGQGCLAAGQCLGR